MQTFSKQDTLSWKEIPLAIEIENPGAKPPLTLLAKKFTNSISFPDQKQRLQLHLAAVLVNNFPNALYAAASDLLGGQGFAMLLPLIRQTTSKLDRLAPAEAQTGPAKRGDDTVMKKHLGLLKKQNDLKKIYRQLSRLIEKQQHVHA